MKQLVIVSVFAIACAGVTWGVVSPGKAKSRAPEIYFQAYEPQKVVYHVTTGGGWFGREHAHLLAVLNNHLNATGEGFADISVIMQGDGLDLLIAAKKDMKIATAIARLKNSGVHFVICYNTLVQRQLHPANDLYGVAREDIVAAGVAEVALLVNKGYVYLRI